MISNSIKDFAKNNFNIGLTSGDKNIHKFLKKYDLNIVDKSPEEVCLELAKFIKTLSSSDIGFAYYGITNGDENVQNLGQGESYFAIFDGTSNKTKHVRSAGIGIPDKRRAIMSSLSLIRNFFKMMKSLSAIQLGNKPELIVDEIDIADPVGNQVMIKLISSGICHSQLHQMHDKNLPKPFLLGHEATGVVLKTGPDCNYVQEGDHVIATWVRRNPIKGRYLPDLKGVSYQEKIKLQDYIYLVRNNNERR